MPHLHSGRVYKACCGKIICQGCVYAADVRDKKSASLCPFCRTPAPDSQKEVIERYKVRMELNDAISMSDFGGFYAQGLHGLPQNYAKAFELWHRAEELGNMAAYNNLGVTYGAGRGVEVDEKKEKHYFELAAMSGSVMARHNLGVDEMQTGNMDRALKHWIIAVEGGFKRSVGSIKRLYSNGHATKDDYANALQAYQAHLNEIKSLQRDEAAAYNADWNYY